jgi:hypothetical protein
MIARTVVAAEMAYCRRLRALASHLLPAAAGASSTHLLPPRGLCAGAPGASAADVEHAPLGFRDNGSGGASHRSGGVSFFQKHGFVVVPDVVPHALVDTVVAELGTFLQVDDWRGDREQWYEGAKPYEQGVWAITPGTVEMYQTQGMWDIRQHPAVHATFAALLGAERLRVGVDRCMVKAPVHPGLNRALKGAADMDVSLAGGWGESLRLHWDLGPPLPSAVQLSVQGQVLLSDHHLDSGGLTVVPGFVSRYEQFVAALPSRDYVYRDRQRFCAELLQHEEPVAVCGKRGDLLIWSQFMPHGSGRNTSDHCRMAQFLTMGIAPPQSAAELEEASRVGEAARARRGYPTGMAEWAERLLAEAPPHQRYPVARLTALGRKLAGERAWG